MDSGAIFSTGNNGLTDIPLNLIKPLTPFLRVKFVWNNPNFQIEEKAYVVALEKGGKV